MFRRARLYKIVALVAALIGLMTVAQIGLWTYHYNTNKKNPTSLCLLNSIAWVHHFQIAKIVALTIQQSADRFNEVYKQALAENDVEKIRRIKIILDGKKTDLAVVAGINAQPYVFSKAIDEAILEILPAPILAPNWLLRHYENFNAYFPSSATLTKVETLFQGLPEYLKDCHQIGLETTENCLSRECATDFESRMAKLRAKYNPAYAAFLETETTSP